MLTIAHRLSTIKSAGIKLELILLYNLFVKLCDIFIDFNFISDQIAVIENGKIADMGSYNELMAREGPFKNLIKHQAMFS